MCEIATVLDPASATELLTMIPANSSSESSANQFRNDENYQPPMSSRGGLNSSSAQKLEYRSHLKNNVALKIATKLTKLRTNMVALIEPAF